MGVKSNRREFLQTGAVVGAGFWVTGRQSAWAQEKGPNAKLNVASIGVGGRGRASLDACKNENIVAVCDIDDNPLDKACKDFPKAKRYNDYRKMIEECQKEIDAVTVGTPDHHHAPAAVRARRRRAEPDQDQPSRPPSGASGRRRRPPAAIGRRRGASSRPRRSAS